jgi:hypothetical protein
VTPSGRAQRNVGVRLVTREVERGAIGRGEVKMPAVLVATVVEPLLDVLAPSGPPSLRELAPDPDPAMARSVLEPQPLATTSTTDESKERNLMPFHPALPHGRIGITCPLESTPAPFVT